MGKKWKQDQWRDDSSDLKRRRSLQYNAGETSRAPDGTAREGIVGLFRDTVVEFKDTIQVTKNETKKEIDELKEKGKKYEEEIGILKEELRILKQGHEDVKTLKQELRILHEELRILKEGHKSQIQAMQTGRCAEVDRYRASPSQRSPPSEPPRLNLRIETILSSTIYKKEIVTTKDRSSRIKVTMYDGGLPIASDHPLASVRVDLVVINGSFNKGKKASWSREEFEENIIKPRDGNSLVKNDTFYLIDGSCHHEGAIIMDNSQQKEVKLGAMITVPTEERVLEGVSNPFKVQESKTKVSKKNKKPSPPVTTPNSEQTTSTPATQDGQGPVSPDEQHSLSPPVIQDVSQKEDCGKHTEFPTDDTGEHNGRSYPPATVQQMVEGNGEASGLDLLLSCCPPPHSIQDPLQAAGQEEVSEADNNAEENKEETPKNKKERSARDRSQGKDKKQDGSKSREAKSLLNTLTPYGTDRLQHERKTVERLVEMIDKEPSRNFVVEKGRGTPLKDIPSVAKRLYMKKPTDLKFLHNILFGRKGETVDFRGHILQFSGCMWYESDRAKAKEKLDRCMKDRLVELCSLLAIPVPKTNIKKEDIVAKLLDFIAEPHAMSDSGLSDDQGSNSRKRKRGGDSSSKTLDVTPKSSKKKFGDVSPSKRRKQALDYDCDEDMDDEDQPMKSDSEEDADEDPTEHEDGYNSAEEKASKKSSEIKDSSGKKKAAAGSTHKIGPPRTTSKSAGKASPSKVSKEKESPGESTKVYSRKKPIISKCTLSSEKEMEENKSSGKGATEGKGELAGGLPSKDEMKKTIIGIIKKVDFNTSTFSDILKKLADYYKIDLAPRKGAIKIMIQEQLTKLLEADNDEDEKEDVEKKQPRRPTA